MKLLKSKKGIVTFILLAVAFILSLVIFLVHENLIDLSTSTDFIGRLQMYTFGTFQSSFSFTFYLTIASEYALHQAILENYYSGGLDETSECKTYRGIPVWNLEDNLCLPLEDQSDVIGMKFKNILKLYLMDFPDYFVPVSSLTLTNSYVKDNEIHIDGGFLDGINLPIDITRTDEHVFITNPVDFFIDPFLIDVNGYVWPLSPKKKANFIVTSLYGFRDIEEVDSFYHNGVDIASSLGEPIYAVQDGTVEYVDSYDNPLSMGKILIKHSKYFSSKILHASKIFVNVGDDIKKGDVIGLVGGYGNGAPNGFVPHLHLEFLMNDIPVDPLLYYIDDLEFIFSNAEDLVSQIHDNRNDYPYESKVTV